MSSPELLAAALADRYRIVRELGAGGMATVYLAEDLKHDRKVAIKVLKPELAAVLGADRFVVEIKTTAAMSHPHILPLFDSGTADGFLYYVMPYIEGETIRDKLTRETQFSIADAVRLTREVAEALDYAHRRGIIHRDIKPENILLHDGRAMVMDFGIALAVSAAAGGRMTETGLSLGTPHYMSPEQATAEKEITPRSDIYSLASVCYEMLAGRPPHVGGPAQQVIMRIITEAAPPVSSLRRTVPSHVNDAVAKALEKLPADRFDTVREFAEALANPAFSVQAPSGALPRPASSAALSGLWRWAAVASGLVAVAAGAWAIRTNSVAAAAARDVGLPPTAPMRLEDRRRTFAVAHDGSFIIYEARVGTVSQLWYRSLVGPEVRAIDGTEGAMGTPRISPDDLRVAFVSRGELKIVPIAGGPVTAVARAADPYGGEWLESGQIFFASDDGRAIRWFDAEPGAGRSVTTPLCILPQLLAGGTSVLCGGGSIKWAYTRDIASPTARHYLRRTARAAGAGPTLVLGADFRVIDDRYLVYMSLDGTIMATRFENRDSLTVGKSVALVPGVRRATYSGAGHFDITRNGSLAFVPGINAEAGQLVRWSSDGRTLPVGVEDGVHLRFSASPDGRRVASVVEGAEQQELRIYDLRTGAKEVVDRGLMLGTPAWSPDSRRIAYRRQEFATPDSELVYLRELDSPAPPRVLVTGQYAARDAGSYRAADFFITSAGQNDARNLVVNPLATPARIDTLPLSSYFISVSPDRKWIVYQNQGAAGLYLQPWPALDRRVQVAANGEEPLWRSANEIVYEVSEPGMRTFYQVRIDPNSPELVGAPVRLFSDTRFADTPGWSSAVMPGGDLMYLQAPAENLGYYVRVVPKWVEAMKRAVDQANR
jgi:serine/threonine-protein kinase